MLYVTTRNRRDAFTVSHALSGNRGCDGGFCVPLQLPVLSGQDINRLAQMPFGQRVAQMLNLFFSVKLSGWDVEFSIGRYPLRMEQLPHRIIMAETWHNPDWNYQRLEANLAQLLQTETDIPGNWVSVAIRMAVLAGLLGFREIAGTGPVDIAVLCGDFTLPISAWYLRKMGFPIGNIICCCNENNQFWDLLCNGQMNTDALRLSTVIPEADVTLPVNLERLISECGGAAEAEHYAARCAAGSVYSVSESLLQQLRKGLYASVVSSTRVETTIPNVYHTHNYLLSPASALVYSGLMDYRAKTGISRTAVVLCDKSPVCDASFVAQAMGVALDVLKKMI